MNIMYWSNGKFQTTSLNTIEFKCLPSVLNKFQLKDIEYRCFGTGHFDMEGEEIYEGAIIEDPGNNLGIVVYNQTESQFIIDFPGNAMAVDWTTKSWAKVVGSVCNVNEVHDKLVPSQILTRLKMNFRAVN